MSSIHKHRMCVHPVGERAGCKRGFTPCGATSAIDRVPQEAGPGVTLHRYARHFTDGDLTINDLAVLWLQMEKERLVEVLFHDGHIRTMGAFCAFASAPGNWFYAAKSGGQFIGIGFANNFSSSGNTAYAHLLSFRAGRDGSFAEAGRLWLRLLHDAGGLDTVIAVVPGCYRGVRRWCESFGFVERMRLPAALKLTRASGMRFTAAHVFEKNLTLEA